MGLAYSELMAQGVRGPCDLGGSTQGAGAGACKVSPLRLRDPGGSGPSQSVTPSDEGSQSKLWLGCWGGHHGAGRAAPRALMGETASEFSVVREVSTAKLLALCALPLIWFWLETIIICPLCGITTQPPAPSLGGAVRNLWLPFWQPTPNLGDAEGLGQSLGQGKGVKGAGCAHPVTGETEAQELGKVESQAPDAASRSSAIPRQSEAEERPPNKGGLHSARAR